MERISVKTIPGLTADRLAWIVGHLPFETINQRGEIRPAPIKKAVLMALCYRYPNVFPSAEDIAAKVSCGVRRAQEILRELEFDRLIRDMTFCPPGVPVWHYRPPRPVIRSSNKAGGTHSDTVQYFVCDRKIVDWYLQRSLYGEDAKPEDERAARRLMDKMDKARETWEDTIEPPQRVPDGTPYGDARAALFVAETVADYKTASRRLTEIRQSEVTGRAA